MASQGRFQKPIAELDQEKLQIAVDALGQWLAFQSSTNASELYRRAFDLFDCQFNPAEYDDVE